MAQTFGKEYRDIDMSFGKHPTHGDLNMVKKTTAIKRAIKNIIFTGKNERLFQPEKGGVIGPLLFENMNALTSARLQQRLLVAIQTEEPRATVLHVGVTIKEEQNGYEIDILFQPDNQVEKENMSLFLERTRG